MEDNIKRPLMDTLVDSKELQILKTVIPFMHESQQKKCAMAVRFIELMKTTALFEDGNQDFSQELKACSGESNQERMSKMLYAVKDLCSEQEKEQIDLLINFCEMSSSCNTMYP